MARQLWRTRCRFVPLSIALLAPATCRVSSAVDQVSSVEVFPTRASRSELPEPRTEARRGRCLLANAPSRRPAPHRHFGSGVFLTDRGHNPRRDGTTRVVFDPLDFVARLAALVPRSRLNLTRFHGGFASNCFERLDTPNIRRERQRSACQMRASNSASVLQASAAATTTASEDSANAGKPPGNPGEISTPRDNSI